MYRNGTKRTDDNDVFDKVAERDDPPVDEIENGTAEVDAAKAAETKTADPEETADGADEAPAPRKNLRRRIGAAAAIVLIVGALGLSAFLGWQLKEQQDIAIAGREALEVARSYAVTLTSVDTNKIDENYAQVLDGATGEFKDMYSQSASQLRQVLIDNKAMSNGTVVDASIKSATKTNVDVLLFVDQSITNTVKPEPRIDRSRVRMTMELVDGRWLASKVDII